MKYLLFFIVIVSANAIANPRITIIAPFSCEDPIESYIRDITQQAFFTTAQLILISKNSDKHVKSTIGLYQEIFNNILFIECPSHTLDSGLINTAIKAAQAPYLSIVSPGNYRDSKILARQLEELEANQAIDVVYSDFYITNDQAGFNDDHKSKWSCIQLPEFNKQLLYCNLVGFHYIWRADLHKKYGYFDESLSFVYLWEFWNRCASLGSQFKKIEGIAGNYFFNFYKSNQKLLSDVDLARFFDEERELRATYNAMWDIHYNFPEKPFVIVIASYNNKRWYKRNLESVFSQHYTNYRVIYIDDCSPDQTGALVEEYCNAHNQKNNVTLIKKQERCGATANIYQAVHLCKKQEIVVILDGDDWLAHTQVLNHLNAIYQDESIWLTYGQFQWFPYNTLGLSAELPQWVIRQNKVREYSWVTSHLRSFYAGLYHKIKKEDLFYEGKFYTMTGDLAIMYPMIEMAGIHTKFVDEVLYIYNKANSLNDDQVNLSMQVSLGAQMRERRRYSAISHW